MLLVEACLKNAEKIVSTSKALQRVCYTVVVFLGM